MATVNPTETGAAKDSTPETTNGRDKRGRFAKGAPSANPKGRPTESHELKILAREKSPEAIRRLLFWMRSNDSTASIAAAKELLARGYGRPEQGVTIDATVSAGPQRVYPAFRDMTPIDASQAYFDALHSPEGDVDFLPPQKTEEEYAAERFREIMGLNEDGSSNRPTTSRPVAQESLPAPPAPTALARAPEPVAATPPERPIARPRPLKVVDPVDQDSVVLTVEQQEDARLRVLRPERVLT